MNGEDIKKILEHNFKEYLGIVAMRDEAKNNLAVMEREIAKITIQIITLASIYEGAFDEIGFGSLLKSVAQTGLTDAVRLVLRAYPSGITPPQVRDKILNMGVNLGVYKNPMAAVHTVLKRLEENDEIERISKPKNGYYYCLKDMENIAGVPQNVPLPSKQINTRRQAQKVIKTPKNKKEGEK